MAMVLQVHAADEWEFSPKCEHSTPGQWLTEMDGELWCFDPPTQLQKDFWLDEPGEPGAETKEERIASLRWKCLKCGTIQMP